MIDSHAHLTSSDLLSDREGVITRAKKAGITKIVNICTDRASLKEGIELAHVCDLICNAAATTPHDVALEGELFFPEVCHAAQSGQLVALGETGLDYHYVHSPKEMQKAFLVQYFELALNVHLPLIFHCREAFDDLFALADLHYRGAPAVLHCFTGTLQEAKRVLDRGWFISLSGILTFKKAAALREVARCVPLERLLVETDAPFLAPESHRGTRNEPAFLSEIVHVLASVLGKEPLEVANVTAENAAQFFSFPKLSA